MNITKATKLAEILKIYPWILDEAVKMDGKFKILKTPVGRLFIGGATLGDLSNKAGIPVDDLIRQITEMIAKRR